MRLSDAVLYTLYLLFLLHVCNVWSVADVSYWPVRSVPARSVVCDYVPVRAHPITATATENVL